MPLFARAFDASMTLYFTVGMTYEELIDYSNMIPVTETESLEMMDWELPNAAALAVTVRETRSQTAECAEVMINYFKLRRQTHSCSSQVLLRGATLGQTEDIPSAVVSR